jgi:alpha-L-fucosidase 2
MPEIEKLRFKWVKEQVEKGVYDTVQKIGDLPYEKFSAPTKIPGAAIEFDLSKLGRVVKNELDITTAISKVKFENGVVFTNYVHAVNQEGYFIFDNCADAALTFDIEWNLVWLACLSSVAALDAPCARKVLWWAIARC